MSDNPFPDENTEQSTGMKEDFSGRDRLVSNVVFNWAAHFVFIVAGFIMPRMIDRRLGKELLGIWDFAWSLTAYFGLVQLGIGSSVNRYVAKYRATKDTHGINQVINSSCFLLCSAGLIVFISTIIVSIMLPSLIGAKLGKNIQQAQWVVFFIGTGMAFQMALSPFHGLLTGFHRWGLHNIIKSGSYLITVVGMVTALLKGGGLRSLAIITLAGQALESATQVIFSYRICRGLHISLSLINFETIKKQFVFGAKTLVPTVSNLLLNQTTSILIIAYLGPAALALYSRPRSLVLHINTLVTKMSMTLVPTISSLQNTGNFKEIRELLISSVRYSIYIVLPIVIILVIFGDAVMQLWMGQDYANRFLIAVLTLGYTMMMVQNPVLNVLSGLNSHGRSGIAKLIASFFSVGLMFIVLGYFKWGVVGAAFAVTLPLTIMNVFYIPILVCRRVGLNIKRYFFLVTVSPIVHIMPFAFCLIAARYIFANALIKGLFWGALTGSTILAVVYFRSVLPVRIKNRLYRLVGLRDSAV